MNDTPEIQRLTKAIANLATALIESAAVISDTRTALKCHRRGVTRTDAHASAKAARQLDDQKAIGGAHECISADC